MSKKVAYVTGGMGGIGTTMCQRLHRDGFTVIAGCGPSRDFKKWLDEQSALGYTFHASVGNVGDWNSTVAAFQQVKAEHGPIDVLVNNAGITTLGSIEEVTLDQFRHEFDVDVVGVFLGCKHVIPKMRPQGGSIINMSSMTGVRAQANLAAYNAAKAAVTHLTKSCALHFAQQKYDIRCNSVHPGAIHTPIIDKVLAQSDDPEALYAFFVSSHPIGRLGKPEEIAAICVYLASDESAFATGAEFRVDGGSTI